MRIGINAHLLSFSGNYRQAGLSRYIDELLFGIPDLAPDISFWGYIGKVELPAARKAALPHNLSLRSGGSKTERPQARILWEQTALPVASQLDHLDLLHCPVNIRPLALTVPAIITIHDLVFLRFARSHHPVKRLYLSAMTGWSARHAAHVITVSEASRQDVIKLLKVRPGRVTTVHNGVGDEFKPLGVDEIDAFRTAKNIAGQAILYIGTLEPRKNLPTLLEAFAALAGKAEFQDVTLYLGGSKGWYYDEIFGTAERLGLVHSGRVQFLGRIPGEELPLWYNSATVFAYPSFYEGFGLPPLEAMACGTPVVAANTSSLPEVVGDAGLLLDPADVEAWAAGLGEMLANAPLRADMSEKARAQAARFSWEQSARETIAVYRKQLAKQIPGKGQARRRGW